MDERRSKPPGSQPKKLLAVAAFVMILLCLAVIVTHSTLDPDIKALITLIIGRFLGYVDAIYSFEFGNTRDSTAPAAPPSPPPEAANKEVVR